VQTSQFCKRNLVSSLRKKNLIIKGDSTSVSMPKPKHGTSNKTKKVENVTSINSLEGTKKKGT
jgi:hypothetical protein